MSSGAAARSLAVDGNHLPVFHGSRRLARYHANGTLIDREQETETAA